LSTLSLKKAALVSKREPEGTVASLYLPVRIPYAEETSARGTRRRPRKRRTDLSGDQMVRP
jgi:hypothetical protein